MPVQIVAPTCTSHLHTTDLRSSIEGNLLEQDALSLAQRELNRSFNLSEGPLIRAQLVRLTSTNNILLITLHHIINDGWSAELLTRELAQYYAAFSTGRRPSIQSLPMQYSEFSIIQRRLLQSGHFDSQFSYWRNILAGAPAVHTLPCDLLRPEQPSYSGATLSVHLDKDLMDGLSDLARRHRATKFMVLAAAFQVLLFKCSGQTDLVIGIPVSGRTMVEAEPLIGFFVNTIVLRARVDRNHRFAELLNTARDALLSAMAHQDVPFDLVVARLGVPRTLNHNPIFQIMFSTFKAAVQDRHFGGLVATPYIVEPTTSRFDLSVNVVEGFNGYWWLQAEYSTELFYQERIATMLREYKMILDSIVKNVEQSLSQLCEAPKTHPMPTFYDLATSSFAANETVSYSTTGTQITSQPDAIERRLARLWGQLLKVKSPTGIDDDFFALGGNSLLAIKLITEVSRSFGKQLPVSSLFLDRTIRGMANRLRGNEPGTLSFTAIAKSGTLPPLFAAGCAREYRDLSRALGTNQPFYQLDVFALQEERLIAGKLMLTTVEQVAEHFIREIRRVQSRGPYFLAGTCEGGIVALEVARQLTRQGDQIGLLMEFDTPIAGYFPSVTKTKHLLWALNQGRLSQSLSRFVRRKFLRWFKVETSREQHIWDTIWTAVRTYDPYPPFGGPICVFRAEELHWPVEDVGKGWERLGSLTICDVPGDHVRMYCNKTTQRIIREKLLAAQARYASERTAVKEGAT